jgi:putative toxin-antitoxin system antitoxin component (TIGR02293 family)
MKTQAPSLHASSRSAALSTIWAMLDAPDLAEEPPAPSTRVMVGERLAGFSSAGACKLLKRGISSQAIGPLGDYLGLGKGVVAEYLDLDRSTANRRVAKGQLLPIHSAESVLRLLELGQMAADTFETEDEALAWLSRTHPMLEGDCPLEAAKTSYGSQRVKDILMAIRFGGVV